jgi:hypothetical protein
VLALLGLYYRLPVEPLLQALSMLLKPIEVNA